MKKKNIVAITGIMFLLSACGTNQEAAIKPTSQEESVQQSVSYTFPERCEETVGCVDLAYDVEIPENLKNSVLYKCKATQVDFDTDKLKAVFGENVQLNLEEEDYTKPVLRTENGYMQYFTPLAYSINNSFYPDSKEGNQDKYKKNENLDFMPYEEAYENVCSSLENLGIDIKETEYVSYALDCDTLTKEETSPMDIDGNVYEDEKHGTYSKEEECYYFAIWQKQQGVQEYHPNVGAFGCIEVANAPIQVFYSKNGIEKLEIDKAFTFEQQQDSVTLKDLSEINQVLTDEFNDILTEENYKVVEGKLVWKTATFGTEMQPAWYFKIDYTTNKGDSYTTYRLVDAETGKLINMEGVY